MKLRPKVILLITSFFVVLGVALLFVQQRILLPSFAELERDAARTDMERVKNSMARDLDLLYSMTADWGNWDATYQFMLDHHPGFIKSSMTVNALQGFKVDAVALVDPSGKFVWATAITPGSGLPMDLDLISRGGLPANHPWQAALQTGTGAQGLIQTNHGAMLAALAPVLDGSGQGRYRGMIMMGRLVTAKEISRLGAQAQVTLSQVSDAELSGDGRSDSLVEHDLVTEIEHVFTDVAGSPALALRIEVPRAITARGRQVVAYASFFVMGAAVLVLLGVLAALNRSVLEPLTRMTRHAVSIARGDDLTLRLDLQRQDEIGDLAKEFDRMVAMLADSRRQLVGRSFDAGIAENASGVLHNLGNAMTPLFVKVAGLENILRTAPVADIELVLGELAKGGVEKARESDLQAFLQLTSRDLAQVIEESREKVSMISQHIQALLALLAEQAVHSRATRIVETVALPDLIDQSAELVAPGLRARLAFNLDDSVRTVGVVRVPRVTLQQVLQNLIMNAAEAVLATGRDHGSLRIAAEVTEMAMTPQLHMKFVDDGVGIREEHLSRIFEKGFTTKSSITNSGIGLHWCANALNALGGQLRAESSGEHRGAIFHLILPLERTADAQIATVN
jgi:two-component system, NtrC family, sensor kinase